MVIISYSNQGSPDVLKPKNKDENMLKKTDNKWFYIVVQNPGTSNEEYMGFRDDETNKTFIPAFATKEEAQQCFLMMPKDVMHKKYEVQAVIQEDLISIASTSGFHVFLMDDTGRIKQRLG